MKITVNLIFEKNVIFGDGDNVNLAESIHAFFLLHKVNLKPVLI